MPRYRANRDDMNVRNWLLLVLGIWVLVSPWVLGFFEASPMLYGNVIAGVLIVVIMMWNIFEK